MDKRDNPPNGRPTGAEARPRRPHAPPEAAQRVAAPPRPADPPQAPKPRADRHRAPKPASSSPKPHAARQGALALLAAVRDGATLAEAASTLAHLSPPERARAQRLAAETLRHRDRAQAVLSPLIRRAPRPAIMDILALATTEMLAWGEAPHGAVNAAVALTRAGGPKGAAASGMVNAVLRQAAGAQRDWDDAGPARLPDWLRAPLAAAWGEAVARAIEAAHEAAPPLDLTARPGAAAPGDPLPTGSHRLPAGTQVTALSGYEAGDWWVQDAAAALPARLLDPQPGEGIADLCAAPGGKTMQLAAAGADVTAIDLSPARLDRVARNLARTGLSARLVAADALTWQPEAALDAVLLDAPCSASGTIRRHPELPLIRDGSAIPDLVALQARLIDHAASLLRPGGRLVYAVCSLLPAEGEDQLEAALARNPDLTVEPPDLQGLDPDWITPRGAIRTRPDHWADRGGLDGFFIVRLRRG